MMDHGKEAIGAMTTKGGMTKQGVQDLNHYGPRRRKGAPGDRVEEKPKATPPVKTVDADKGVTE